MAEADSNFHLELLDLGAYRGSCARRTLVLGRAAETQNRVAVRQIFSLSDCGRFEELGQALGNISAATLDVAELRRLTKSEQRKLRRIGAWYRDIWVGVEDRVSLEDYTIDGADQRTDYLLLLARRGELRLLANDLRANFETYRKSKAVPQHVLIYCLRKVLASGSGSASALHQFNQACEGLWDEQELLDTLVAHWELARGDLFLECALHTAAARLCEVEVQRLARRHSGLDLTLVTDPESPFTRLTPVPRASGRPRVAICVSGMLRDADNGAAAIREHLVAPLDADVFVDVWDVEQNWFGLGGATGLGRVMSREHTALLPARLRTVAAFTKQFPNVARSWSRPSSSKLTSERVEALYRPSAMRIERDEDFLSTVESHAGLSFKGSFNQARMFYKMNRSFDLMASYEDTHNIRYDYVVRIRPDFIFSDNLKLEELERLGEGEVRVDWLGEVGPSDMFAVGRRATMEAYSQLWSVMYAAKRVSPFVTYPNVRSHRLLFLWLHLNDIDMTRTSVSAELSKGLDVPVPEFSKELAEDLSGPAAAHRDAPWVGEFFSAMANRGRQQHERGPLESIARFVGR